LSGPKKTLHLTFFKGPGQVAGLVGAVRKLWGSSAGQVKNETWLEDGRGITAYSPTRGTRIVYWSRNGGGPIRVGQRQPRNLAGGLSQRARPNS